MADGQGVFSPFLYDPEYAYDMSYQLYPTDLTDSQ
jgi:hypothetical protein